MTEDFELKEVRKTEKVSGMPAGTRRMLLAFQLMLFALTGCASAQSTQQQITETPTPIATLETQDLCPKPTSDYLDPVDALMAGESIPKIPVTTYPNAIEQISALEITREDLIGDYDPQERMPILLVGVGFTNTTDLTSQLTTNARIIMNGLNGLPVDINILTIPNVPIELEHVGRLLTMKDPEQGVQLLRRIYLQTGLVYATINFQFNSDIWWGSGGFFSVTSAKHPLSASYLTLHEMGHSLGRGFFDGSTIRRTGTGASDRYVRTYELSELQHWSTGFYTNTQFLAPYTRQVISATGTTTSTTPYTCGKYPVQTIETVHQRTIMGNYIPEPEDLLDIAEKGGSPFSPFELELLRGQIEYIIQEMNR